VTGDDLARAIALREALRAALAANHDGAPIPETATSVLNATADRANLTLAVTTASPLGGSAPDRRRGRRLGRVWPSSRQP
jgi:hypothetical protein